MASDGQVTHEPKSLPSVEARRARNVALIAALELR
jgi:hypothetical protein